MSLLSAQRYLRRLPALLVAIIEGKDQPLRLKKRGWLSENLFELVLSYKHVRNFPSDETFAYLMELLSESFTQWTPGNEESTREWVASWRREARRARADNRELLIELSCFIGEPDVAKRFVCAGETSPALSLALGDPKLTPVGWKLVRLRRLWVEQGKIFRRKTSQPMKVFEKGQIVSVKMRGEVSGFRSEPKRVGPALLHASGMIHIFGDLLLTDPAADPSLGEASGVWPFLQGSENNLTEALLSESAFRGAPALHLDKAIDMTGRNSSNYWHAMIEYLPRMKATEGESDIPIIASLALQPASRRALELLAGANREILYLRHDEHAHVEELTVPGFSTRVLDNLVAPIDAGAAYEVEPLHWLRERLLAEVKTPKHWPERFFVEREGRFRNATNWPAARELLLTQGFTGVELSGLSLEEQIGLFSKASFIVGIGGAQWANLLFCQPGTRVLSIAPRIMVEWPLHDQIAKDFGNDFLSLGCDQQRPRQADEKLANFLQEDFVIDLDELKGALKHFS